MTMRSLGVRLVDASHLVALGLWIATLCAVGAAATGVFVMLPRIGVVLPEYAAYVQSLGGDPAREYGRLAGGMVMQPVFRAAGRAEVALAAITLGTLALQLTLLRARWPWRRPANWLRAALLAGCAALACLQTFERGPRMERTLTTAWMDARDGSFESANRVRENFESLHLRADREFRARLFVLIAALGLVAFAAVPRTGSERGDDATSTSSGRRPSRERREGAPT